MQPFSLRNTQYGFSLIEAMIATLVISVGLLGVAGMQMVAMKGSQHAFQQGQASNLMQGLLERMRSNSDGVYAEHYNIVNSAGIQCSNPLAKNCEDGVTSCNAEELADSDIYHTICGYGSMHIGGVQNSLAGGLISVSCLGGVGTCASGVNVKVNWNERTLGEDGGSHNMLPREISLDTVIAP